MRLLLLILSCLLTLITHAIAQDPRLNLFCYGSPATADERPGFEILVNEAYAVGYSDYYKNPLWVVYRLGNQKNLIETQKWERPSRFIVDTRTQAKVSHEDYSGSGYNRGHITPNAGLLNQYGQLAQLETYFMSNTCPNPLNWIEVFGWNLRVEFEMIYRKTTQMMKRFMSCGLSQVRFSIKRLQKQ